MMPESIACFNYLIIANFEIFLLSVEKESMLFNKDDIPIVHC
jgi:hypothetical protein